MQESEKDSVKPNCFNQNFIPIVLWTLCGGAGISVLTTGMAYFIGTITYDCDQYLGYPVGPTPHADLTVAPNATTCPPQLNSNSPPICFKPGCDEDMKEAALIGAGVGVGGTALTLAAMGLYQAGYLLRRRLSRKSAPSETTLLISAEAGGREKVQHVRQDSQTNRM